MKLFDNLDKLVLKFKNIELKKNDFRLKNIFSVLFKDNNDTKKVSFIDCDKIYYIEKQNDKSLFYNENDYQYFKIQFQNEVNTVCKIKNLSFKEGLKELYFNSLYK